MLIFRSIFSLHVYKATTIQDQLILF